MFINGEEVSVDDAVRLIRRQPDELGWVTAALAAAPIVAPAVTPLLQPLVSNVTGKVKQLPVISNIVGTKTKSPIPRRRVIRRTAAQPVIRRQPAQVRMVQRSTPVARSTQQPTVVYRSTQSQEGGMPSWLLPVGIAGVVGVGALVLMNRNKSEEL